MEKKISLKEAVQKYGLKLHLCPLRWKTSSEQELAQVMDKVYRPNNSHWFYSKHSQKCLLNVQNVLLNNIDVIYDPDDNNDNWYVNAFIYTFLFKNVGTLNKCAKKIVEVRLQNDLLNRGVDPWSIDAKVYKILQEREFEQAKIPEKIEDQTSFKFYEQMVNDMMSGEYTKEEYFAIYNTLTEAGLFEDARPVEIEIVEDKKTYDECKDCCVAFTPWEEDDTPTSTAKKLFGDFRDDSKKLKKTKKSGGK